MVFYIVNFTIFGDDGFRHSAATVQPFNPAPPTEKKSSFLKTVMMSTDNPRGFTDP